MVARDAAGPRFKFTGIRKILYFPVNCLKDGNKRKSGRKWPHFLMEKIENARTEPTLDVRHSTKNKKSFFFSKKYRILEAGGLGQSQWADRGINVAWITRTTTED